MSKHERWLAKAVLVCGCAPFALYGQATPTVTWTGGGGDSNWGNADNWSWAGDNGQCKGYAPGTIPTSPGNICYAPNVVIPTGVNVNETNVQFLSDINNFSIGANSVLAGGGVAAQGNVMVASGAIVDGAVRAYGSGGVLTNQGTIIGGVIAATVNNSGTIQLAGVDVDQAYATTQGTNTGIIEATSNGSALGQGTSILDGPWNNAKGTIQVDSGATLVCQAATVTGGNFDVSNGGAVTTSGSGLTLAGTVNSTSFVIDVVGSLGTAPVTITGTLLIAGNLIVGNTTGVSTLDVNNGGVLNVNGGNTILGAQAGASGQLEISSTSATPITTGNLIIGAAGTGYVSVSGGATLTAGTVTLGSQPSGNGYLVVSGKSVVNYVTLNAINGSTSYGGAISVYGGANLVGAPDQQQKDSAADHLSAGAQISGSGSAWKVQSGLTVNAGSLTVSSGGAVGVSCMSCPQELDSFQVTGKSTVGVTGSMSTLSAARSDIGAGATLTVQAGAHVDLFYSLEGMVTVDGSGSQMTANGYLAGAGTLTVQNQAKFSAPDELIVDGPTAQLIVQSGGVIYSGFVFITSGAALIEDTGALNMTGNNPLINIGDGVFGAATLTIRGTGKLSGAHDVSVYSNGTLQIANGDSVTVSGMVELENLSQTPNKQAPGPTINVLQGALTIGSVSGPGTQGWVTVGPGGTLKGGVICPETLSPGKACIPNTLVNGPGTVDGSVSNVGGTVSLDPTTLSITQNFQQTSGTLDLEIQGTQSGDYDQITAGGSIQISGGTVEFDFGNGFAPSSGDKFNLLSAPGGISVSGASLTTTGLASGFNYTTSASSGQFDLTATNSGTATTSAPSPPPTPTLASSDSASGAMELAAGSLASGYGTGLATGQPASAPYIWPTTISGTSVSIVDATGTTTQAPLLYVSSTEVDYQIPDTVALGPATVTVTAGDGTTASGPVNLVPYAPGLFAVNSAGLSASYADCVSASGQQSTVLTFQVVNGAVVAVPLNLKACQETVLELWGTGIDAATASTVEVTIGGLDATVLYAGPQGIYPGVDQVNVVIPQSLAGGGNVPVVLSIGGVTSNTVNVTIQ
jgi:uncharacterized protein (TIGR03437 family)